MMPYVAFELRLWAADRRYWQQVQALMLANDASDDAAIARTELQRMANG